MTPEAQPPSWRCRDIAAAEWRQGSRRCHPHRPPRCACTVRAPHTQPEALHQTQLEAILPACNDPLPPAEPRQHRRDLLAVEHHGAPNALALGADDTRPATAMWARGEPTPARLSPSVPLVMEDDESSGAMNARGLDPHAMLSPTDRLPNRANERRRPGPSHASRSFGIWT